MAIKIANRLLALAFITGGAAPVFQRNLGFLSVTRVLGVGRYTLTLDTEKDLAIPFSQVNLQSSNGGTVLRYGVIRVSNNVFTCVFQATVGGADTDPVAFTISISGM